MIKRLIALAIVFFSNQWTWWPRGERLLDWNVEVEQGYHLLSVDHGGAKIVAYRLIVTYLTYLVLPYAKFLPGRYYRGLHGLLDFQGRVEGRYVVCHSEQKFRYFPGPIKRRGGRRDVKSRLKILKHQVEEKKHSKSRRGREGSFAHSYYKRHSSRRQSTSIFYREHPPPTGWSPRSPLWPGHTFPLSYALSTSCVRSLYVASSVDWFIVHCFWRKYCQGRYALRVCIGRCND